MMTNFNAATLRLYRRLLVLPLLLWLILMLCGRVFADDGSDGAQDRFSPSSGATAVVLIDANSSKILYGANSRQPLAMASTTKIMTALLLLENQALTDTLWVPFEARGIIGSKLYLEPGERYSAKEMLLALMVESANDAAVTIAVNVAGSVENFVKMMNERARQLGLQQTSFANPHGLDAPDHYASALDLALLTREAMQVPAFREAAAQTNVTIAHPIESGVRTLNSHNRFLTNFPGATGVKTGFTNNAQFCLVGSAKRDGVELIGVILGGNHADAVADDMAQLMEWGFANFVPHTIVAETEHISVAVEQAGERGRDSVQNVLMRPETALTHLLPRDEQFDQSAVELQVNGDLLAVTYRGEPVGVVKLVPVTDIPAADDGKSLSVALDTGLRLNDYGPYGLAGAVLIFVLYRRSRRRQQYSRYRWRGVRKRTPGGVVR